MKNELAMFTKDGPYLYFKTNKTTAKEAYEEFCSICERIGINDDNFNPCELILRNSDFEDIDKYTYTY